MLVSMLESDKDNLFSFVQISCSLSRSSTKVSCRWNLAQACRVRLYTLSYWIPSMRSKRENWFAITTTVTGESSGDAQVENWGEKKNNFPLSLFGTKVNAAVSGSGQWLLYLLGWMVSFLDSSDGREIVFV